MARYRSEVHAFSAAADRRAYETSRLPDDLRERVQEIERDAAEKKDRLRDEQAMNREADLAAVRAELRRQHPQKTFDWTREAKHQASDREIERKANDAVDRRYAVAERHADAYRDRQIDAVIALNRTQDAEPSRTPGPDVLAASRGVDLGGDFGRAADHGHEGPSR